MEYGINIGINVKAIDKARLQANNDKIWLNATVFFKPESPDTYGQHGMITQNVSKEEKDNGVKGAILGNVKCFYKKDEQEDRPERNQENPTYEQNKPVPDDDIPF